MRHARVILNSSWPSGPDLHDSWPRASRSRGGAGCSPIRSQPESPASPHAVTDRRGGVDSRGARSRLIWREPDRGQDRRAPSAPIIGVSRQRLLQVAATDPTFRPTSTPASAPSGSAPTSRTTLPPASHAQTGNCARLPSLAKLGPAPFRRYGRRNSFRRAYTGPLS